MKLCGIIVLYNPELFLLKEVINAILTQVDHVVIIDNSTVNLEDGLRNISKFKNYTYLPLFKNEGIASAQNIGIRYAKEHAYEFVIFFDQDSVPDKFFIRKMAANYHDLIDSGYKVGAMGPRSISRKTGQRYAAKFNTGTFIGGKEITEIAQIISSGSLVAIKTFELVGGFNKNLFIDIVDFEWCWRAALYDFKHFIVEDAYLEHMFGTKEWRVFGFRVTVPSSFRIFYQYRNYIWLLDKNYVPRYWKMSNGFKLLVKFFLLPVINKNGLAYMKNSLKGIKDGIYNRKKYNEGISMF